MGVQQDVAVVGGGLAGLVAANVAADAGCGVVIHDARPGGRARSDPHPGGAFNRGPHALYLAGHGLRVLAELGIDPAGFVPPLDGALALRDGELHVLPRGGTTLLRTTLLGVRERVEAARVLGSVSSVDASALAGSSLAAWLDSEVRSNGVRDLVEALVRLSTYADDPAHLSAAVAVTQLQLAASGGVRYVDGGWQTIVDALVARASAAGAVLERSNVSSVVPVGDHFELRHPAGVSRAAAVVLAVGGPAAAERLCGLDLGAAGARPAVMSSLDVAVDELPEPARRFVLGIDRPYYFSVHTPPGHPGVVTFHAGRYIRPGDDAGAGETRAELEAFVDLVQPRWRERLVYQRYLHRMVASTAVPTTSPRPDVAGPMRGLALAGDWVGPDGHLADASLASGLHAGRSVVRHVAGRTDRQPV